MNRLFNFTASCATAVGQVRYINEVFTDVKVTEDVVYGSTNLAEQLNVTFTKTGGAL